MQQLVLETPIFFSVSFTQHACSGNTDFFFFHTVKRDFILVFVSDETNHFVWRKGFN